MNHKFLPVVFQFFAEFFTKLGVFHAAVVLHISLLSNILRAPMFFFSITPIGRILARFSKDIDVIDVTLPEKVSSVMYCLFQVNFN